MSFQGDHDERRGRFFTFGPLVVWAAVVLILGSGPGSSAQTSRFIGPLIAFLFPDAAPETILQIHGLIRKSAHFIEYAILGLVAARAFLLSGGRRLRSYWFSAALAVSAAVAVVDEVNQSFYTSRTGSGWDVLLDISGAVAALTLFWFFRRRSPRA